LKIKINDKEIDFTLKRRRGVQSVRLAIYSNGIFVVTAPKWYPLYIINKFLAEKAEWIYNKLKNVDFAELKFKQKTEKINYQTQKETTRKIIKKRLDFFNRYYNFEYNRISVKNQKSCWGSASCKGNLNFNYKVANLPDDLRDYVLVHELCHLKEMNHGGEFWKLVAEIFPNYKSLRKKLKNIKFSAEDACLSGGNRS